MYVVRNVYGKKKIVTKETSHAAEELSSAATTAEPAP